VIHIGFVLLVAFLVRWVLYWLFPTQTWLFHPSVSGKTIWMGVGLLLALPARRVLDRFYPIAHGGG